MQLQLVYRGGMKPAPTLPEPNPTAVMAAGCAAFKVRRLARRVTHIYDEALAPSRLTVGQFGILAHLRRQRGIGIAALAEQLTLDASTLSRLIRPLAKQALLTIAPDPEDGRAKLLWLTDSGAERVRSARAGWETAHATVSGRLGPSRLAALQFALDDAYHHLS